MEKGGCTSLFIGFAVFVGLIALIAAGGPIALTVAVAIAVYGGPITGVAVLVIVGVLALLAALDPN
jgi:hypothetical protein